MLVMKFGGTSVQDAAAMRNAVEIVSSRLDRAPIVVVSAMARVTDMLLRIAEAAKVRRLDNALSMIEEVRDRHLTTASELLDGTELLHGVEREIEKRIEEIEKLARSVSTLGELTPRTQDSIVSFGERLSSVIVAAAMREGALEAELVDSREFIVTDDRFTKAAPLMEATAKRTREVLLPLIKAGRLPVAQGFIGSTEEGVTTTIGRGGSDYSAALIGAGLGAEAIEIWTDVDGLMTADPNIYSAALTVKHCSFDEAADLTLFGAKVLHPKAIQPAAQKNIAVHIYNSKRPEAGGTTISAEPVKCTNPIKSIAFKSPVTIIDGSPLKGQRFISADELLRAFLEALAGRRIKPLIASASASNVVLAIDSNELRHGGRDLIEAVSNYGTASAEDHRAIISLVGEGLRRDPKLAGRVFKSTGDIDLGIISHGSSPITMSFVVAEADVEKIIARLHKTFFDQVDPNVFE